MDFDSRKVYGDTFISDGLVFLQNIHFEICDDTLEDSHDEASDV